MRSELEVADIFRRHGDTFRAAQGNQLSLDQRKVMAAIEACRTSALSSHVERCEDCGSIRVAYDSCRDRHCPKCRVWRASDGLQIAAPNCCHCLFFMSSSPCRRQSRQSLSQNKALVYDILLKAAPRIRVITADPNMAPRPA